MFVKEKHLLFLHFKCPLSFMIRFSPSDVLSKAYTMQRATQGGFTYLPSFTSAWLSLLFSNLLINSPARQRPSIQSLSMPQKSLWTAHKQKGPSGVLIMVRQKWIQLGTMGLQVWLLALLSGLKIRRCHELWRRLQMWFRSGVTAVWVGRCGSAAVAPFEPVAWEPPYAVGSVLKCKNFKKKEKGLQDCQSPQLSSPFFPWSSL